MHSDFGNEECNCSEHKTEGISLKNDETTTAGLEEVLSLSAVLERLISLDECGNFLEPVDDTLVPNDSQNIKNSMCFTIMRQKVDTKHYTSWAAFVEDFQFICSNSMQYHPKHSSIWNMANSLLVEGKKCLEQFGTKAEWILKNERNGKVVREECDNEVKWAYNGVGVIRGKEDFKIVNAILRDVESPLGERRGEFPLYNNAGNEAMENPQHEKVHEVSTIGAFEGGESGLDYRPRLEQEELSRGGFTDKREPYMKQSSASDEGHLVDVEVDILECCTEATPDLRTNSDSQATECSSSFGDTDSDGAASCCDEAESSLLRDGNGGAVSENDNAGMMPKRRKTMLDGNWKECRSGIEWRCHWLNLRIREAQSQLAKYNRVLERIGTSKSNTALQFSSSLAARTNFVRHSGSSKARLLRRKRKKSENISDLSAYMSRHPVFSIYEKKRKPEVEGISIEATHDERCIAPDVFDGIQGVDSFGEGGPMEGMWPKYNPDSVEQLLWDIEVVRMRARRTRSQLSRILPELSLSRQALAKRFFTHPIPIPTAPPPPPPPLYPVRPPARTSGQKISTHGKNGMVNASSAAGLKVNPQRRRNADYDISHVVMPGNVLPTAIEPTMHDFIRTPQWRLVDQIAVQDQSARGGTTSSDEENTDDEVYIKRHTVIELKERQQRFAPLAHKNKAISKFSDGKLAEMASGIFNMKSGGGGGNTNANASRVEELFHIRRKGKRSKRQTAQNKQFRRKFGYVSAFSSELKKENMPWRRNIPGGS